MFEKKQIEWKSFGTNHHRSKKSIKMSKAAKLTTSKNEVTNLRYRNLSKIYICINIFFKSLITISTYIVVVVLRE